LIVTLGYGEANDVDTATLSFSVSDTTNFKIDGDNLKTKISIDTVGDMDINITADDGTNAPITQAFTIAVITNIPDIRGSVVNVGNSKVKTFTKDMRIGISYFNRDTEIFGSLIIYSFSKL
jgi:hypothetical protein